MTEAEDRAEELKREFGMASNIRDYQINAARILTPFAEENPIREDTRIKLEYLSNYAESYEARRIAKEALGDEHLTEEELDYREMMGFDVR